MGGINDYIRIGQKMKQIRKLNGISQKEMAEKLSIAQSSYSNYENENREPPFSLICQFCEHFGISIDSIIRSEIEINKKEFEDINENILRELQALKKENEELKRQREMILKILKGSN